MKALLAVTCIAILATIAYFFVGEYAAHRTALKREATIIEMTRIEQAAREAEKQRLKQSVEKSQREAPLRECKQYVKELRAYNTFEHPQYVRPESDLRSLVRRCISDKIISAADVADLANRL